MSKGLLRRARLCVALVALPAAAVAQDTPPLFASEDTLRLSIEGPLATMMRERSETDYYQGKLRYDDGRDYEIDLRFRTRGKYRRRKDTCRFPPVRFRFTKKDVEGTVFEGQRALKLVAHCRPRSNRFEQYVLKEYLAYKLMELHSPMSFRTRLMRINWIDTDGKHKPDERYGFVIEHDDALAERQGMVPAENHRIVYEQLDQRQAAIVAIFQYLIANTDFSMVAGPPEEPCCHNGILLTADQQTFYPVPYDFDFSGLVDAPYAEPNPRFKIKSVKTRLYRGTCAQTPEIPATIALFLEKQAAVTALVNDLDGLSKSVRGRASAFIDKFYEDISNPQRVETKFIKDCS